MSAPSMGGTSSGLSSEHQAVDRHRHPSTVIENGDLLLPTGPGWGADLDEEFVRVHPPKR